VGFGQSFDMWGQCEGKQRWTWFLDWTSISMELPPLIWAKTVFLHIEDSVFILGQAEFGMTVCWNLLIMNRQFSKSTVILGERNRLCILGSLTFTL
jgi:hypothetical protein